jgi:hypothetical protein
LGRTSVIFKDSRTGSANRSPTFCHCAKTLFRPIATAGQGGAGGAASSDGNAGHGAGGRGTGGEGADMSFIYVHPEKK